MGVATGSRVSLLEPQSSQLRSIKRGYKVAESKKQTAIVFGTPNLEMIERQVV